MSSPHATSAAPDPASGATIPAAWPHGWTKKRVAVNKVSSNSGPSHSTGSQPPRTVEMSCMDIGPVNAHTVIVFLHGNPTSSYMWRNVMARIASQNPTLRLIAPDLVGMGDSGKLNFDWETAEKGSSPTDKNPTSDAGPSDPYAASEQCAYFTNFMEKIPPSKVASSERIVLVVHSWGALVGGKWAFEYARAITSANVLLVVLETVFRPFPSWESLPESLRGAFQVLRTTPAGENFALTQNGVVENAIPGGCVRELTRDGPEMAEYRRPYAVEDARRPILSWIRSVPVAGNPEFVHNSLDNIAEWLSGENKEVPPPQVLFINGDPGSSLVGEEREFVRSWPKVTEVTVRGNHMLTEDSPVEIGDAIVEWLGQM